MKIRPLTEIDYDKNIVISQYLEVWEDGDIFDIVYYINKWEENNKDVSRVQE